MSKHHLPTLPTLPPPGISSHWVETADSYARECARHVVAAFRRRGPGIVVVPTILGLRRRRRG